MAGMPLGPVTVATMVEVPAPSVGTLSGVAVVFTVYGLGGGGSETVPTPIPPLIPAVVTPALVLHAVGSGGWKARTPTAWSPANRVVVTVSDVGWPGPGFTAGRGMLGMTAPCRATAAAAPSVE